MSIAMATRVRRAATNERNDANMASVTCEESDSRRAIKVAPAATGCTARPRVALTPMVMLFEVDSSCTV